MATRHDRIIKLEKTAEIIISWRGSTSSLLVHTVMFVVAFLLPLFGVIAFESMLLVLTTVVSLEAIYLSIFIQMSVNKTTQHIEFIQEDVNEIQEDIDEIQEDIDEIQEDIEDIVDEDEVSEKVEKTILKSNVSNNTNEIKALKNKILELQHELETLKKNR
ncbi:MAG: DUF1003 domain-containing protein [Cloacibacterium sp.]|nr:DUF1003 domain-containing protein [Cloacibacterium sp.]